MSPFIHGRIGQGGPECRCGAFVSTHTGEEEVVQFPPINLDDCTQDVQCAELCLAEWEEATNGGDLCNPTGDGDTIADDMCASLAEKGVDRLQPHTVYLYYNLCEGPWQWDGVQSQQELECKNDTAIIDCAGPSGTPMFSTTMLP
ncbi:uncharacterized protein LOC127000966 [Eriocheir sinensis]|uniref:uncharacterized protein LOC127000966 n=1 Tax=Eriocheir sinensis TaxID=95602 RepID=UPI0021C9A12C|nr:uncharacterized protein LOC127000966 [Eriocheir sinensis]